MTTLTASQKQSIWDRDGGACHYCGQSVPPDQRSVDHIWPQVLGGTHAKSNLVAACVDCNTRLGDRTDKCRCWFCMAGMRAQWERRIEEISR